MDDIQAPQRRAWRSMNVGPRLGAPGSGWWWSPNTHPQRELRVSLSLCQLTLLEKQVVSSLYGSANIRYDIPRLLGLYRRGQLDLEGLVTTRYKLEEVNEGYADMKAGKNIRGVLIYP
jgi:Zn-dependent alcohol dehydrogenase